MGVESGEIDVDKYASFEEHHAHDFPGFTQGKNTAAEKNHLTTKHGLRTPEGSLVSAKSRPSLDDLVRASTDHSPQLSRMHSFSSHLFHLFHLLYF